MRTSAGLHELETKSGAKKFRFRLPNLGEKPRASEGWLEVNFQK